MPTAGADVKYKFLSHTLYEQLKSQDKLDDNTLYVSNYPGTTLEQSGADYYLGKIRLTDIVVLDKIPSLTPNPTGTSISTLIGSPYKLYIYYPQDSSSKSKGLNLYYFDSYKNAFCPFTTSTLTEFVVCGNGYTRCTLIDGTTTYMPNVDNSIVPAEGQFLAYNSETGHFIPMTCEGTGEVVVNNSITIEDIINDLSPSSNMTYSSNKIEQVVNTAMNTVANSIKTDDLTVTTGTNDILAVDTLSGSGVTTFRINHNTNKSEANLAFTMSNTIINPNSKFQTIVSATIDKYGHTSATLGYLQTNFGGVFSSPNETDFTNNKLTATNLYYFTNTTE